MKKILSGAALITFLSVGHAHDSWAPHTHTLDNRYSDLFLLCVLGMIGFAASTIVLWAVSKHRDSKADRRRKPSR